MGLNPTLFSQFHCNRAWPRRAYYYCSVEKMVRSHLLVQSRMSRSLILLTPFSQGIRPIILAESRGPWWDRRRKVNLFCPPHSRLLLYCCFAHDPSSLFLTFTNKYRSIVVSGHDELEPSFPLPVPLPTQPSVLTDLIMSFIVSSDPISVPIPSFVCIVMTRIQQPTFAPDVRYIWHTGPLSSAKITVCFSLTLLAL